MSNTDYTPDYHCKKCGQGFPDKYRLGNHVRHKHKRFKCPECGESMGSPQGLGRHRQSAHGVAGSSHTTVSERNRKVKGGPNGSFRKAQKQLPAITTSDILRQDAPSSEVTGVISFACGHVAAWMESYARSSGVPFPVIARWVGKFLLDTKDR